MMHFILIRSNHFQSTLTKIRSSGVTRMVSEPYDRIAENRAAEAASSPHRLAQFRLVGRYLAQYEFAACRCSGAIRPIKIHCSPRTSLSIGAPTCSLASPARAFVWFPFVFGLYRAQPKETWKWSRCAPHCRPTPLFYAISDQGQAQAVTRLRDQKFSVKQVLSVLS